jgi:periplasmic divalent cation tolerance protein
MNSQHIVVLCTCPDTATAGNIARTLVSERLAACVNRIDAVRSTYEWEGQLADEPEVLLVIKTSAERFAELEVRLKSVHPYQVPEIIALPVVAGSDGYLAWLRRQSRASES